MRAYWYDNLPGDQREPHDSGREVSLDQLSRVGVLYYNYSDIEQVDALASERSYKNRDVITVSPGSMGDVYETKVKSFFAEHMHEDEEIRYIRDGKGYFDVRNEGDEWIRILLEKDDLIILPAGIYHRFTTDESNFIVAMRLFKEEPKWTPLNRGPDVDVNPYRQDQCLLVFERRWDLALSCEAAQEMDAFKVEDLGFNGVAENVALPGSDGGAQQPDLNASPGRARHELKVELPSSCDPPGPNNPPKQLVWIIFGATGHIGRSLTSCALRHNDLVVAVGQTHVNLPASMQNWHPNCLGTLCDVRSRATVEAVITKTIEKFGRIDLIANCSGTAIIGACEDQDEHEIRNQIETNFMGTLNILQLSLPYFREQAHGRYLIFSSTTGALGVPGLGPYCASKYAVEGLIEALLYEVDAFNIKATLVEPGLVRRDDPDQPEREKIVGTGLPLYGHFLIKPASEPYSSPTSPAQHYKRMVQWLGDRQPTSVVKSAELVWQLGHCSFPPLRLLLGSFAVESIRDRLRCVIEEGEDWRELNWPSEESSGAGDEKDEKEEPERDEEADDDVKEETAHN
ncbi:hypothetical protein V494_05180 [Pseudogymnoascus sp. VKM F-4513 (FW-928)]|nr:hypothetical protein V494_05180 [Pseudogymnoascus sp. VKM F-4513 (FW-928)]